jgi:hypothetical protein
MRSISNFIEDRLKLKVNEDKSKVCRVGKSRFSGYTIKENGDLILNPKSIEKMKAKVREITRRNRGARFERVIAELNPKLRGWLNYFRYARCHGHLQKLDAWIRRKLRCYRIKQCKRAYTLQQFLHRNGVDIHQGWLLALSGKGLWRKSGSPQVSQAMGNEWFAKLSLYSLSANYVSLNHLQKPPCTQVRTVV